MAKEYGDFPVHGPDGWTGEWQRESIKVSPSLATLRATNRYYVISDAQLKRDLEGRTLDDVYRENRAKRGAERRYEPRTLDGTGGLLGAKQDALAEEYMAWCKARKHKPHPASLDANHPINAHREKAPRKETER